MRAIFRRFPATLDSVPSGRGAMTGSPDWREIMRRSGAGPVNAEIAEAEFLSEATVKTHISRILTWKARAA